MCACVRARNITVHIPGGQGSLPHDSLLFTLRVTHPYQYGVHLITPYLTRVPPPHDALHLLQAPHVTIQYQKQNTASHYRPHVNPTSLTSIGASTSNTIRLSKDGVRIASCSRILPPQKAAVDASSTHFVAASTPDAAVSPTAPTHIYNSVCAQGSLTNCVMATLRSGWLTGSVARPPAVTPGSLLGKCAFARLVRLAFHRLSVATSRAITARHAALTPSSPRESIVLYRHTLYIQQ